MLESEIIENFLKAKAFGVAGASLNREKYGNKVLRAYIQNHKTVYPLHPIEKTIESISCYSSIAELPATVSSLSIITPPTVTEFLVQEAIKKGIAYIWMQPGAESDRAIEACHNNNVQLIYGGPCILVVLGYHE